MSMQSSSSGARRPLFIGLSVACAVLLVASIALGITSVRLLSAPTASAPTPTPTPTATGQNTIQSVLGVDVEIHSELGFGEVAVSSQEGDDSTAVFAPITWKDDTEAVTVSFDLTAYDTDGRIIERTLNRSYLLPKQEALFYETFRSDITDAARITIEQTRLERSTPTNSGGITLDAMTELVWPWMELSATSTLSAAVDYPGLYVVGYVDGEVFSVCSTLATVPAGGSFTSNCDLVAAASSERILGADELPPDAEFAVFLTLDEP